MALTDKLTTLIATRFNTMVLHLYPGESFVHRTGMVSKAPYAPIYLLDELKKDSGDTVRYPLIKSLSGAGVSGDTDLEDTEEAMIYSANSITIDQYRHAVKLKGRFTEQQMAVRMRDDMVPALSTWLGHKKDILFFTAMKMSGVYDTVTNAPHTPQAVVYGGDAKAFNELDGGDVMNTNVIKKVVRVAQKRGIHGLRVPGFGLVNGILIITPAQALDLSNDPKFITAQEHAFSGRGLDNPLFQNMLGIYNNVVIHVDFHDPGLAGLTNSSLLYQDTEASEVYDRVEAIFLGARACGYAEVVESELNPSDKTDYKNRIGLGISMMGGFGKTQINMGDYTTAKNRDYGVVYVCTSADKL